VPDGFDVEQERNDGYKKYAMAIGLNPDELVARSAGLNSGQSAQIAENAAEEAGGLPFFVKDFEDQINFLVMPKPTIFQVTTNDIRDKKLKADLDQTIANTINVMRGSAQAPGWITDEMALQLSVDEHILPPEFLPEDVTPAGMLTDSGDGSKAPAPTPRAPYAGQVTPPPAAPAPGAPPAMKARILTTKEHDAAFARPDWLPIEHAYTIIQNVLPLDVRNRIGSQSATEDDAALFARKVAWLKSIYVDTKAKDDPDWEEAVKWAEEASKE
jgi:hypothetical protein